jgi:hypothetical protein
LLPLRCLSVRAYPDFHLKIYEHKSGQKYKRNNNKKHDKMQGEKVKHGLYGWMRTIMPISD